MYKKKWKKGRQYSNLNNLVYDIMHHEFVFYRDKCQNHAWMQNLQLHQLNIALINGYLFRAIKAGE